MLTVLCSALSSFVLLSRTLLMNSIREAAVVHQRLLYYFPRGELKVRPLHSTHSLWPEKWESIRTLRSCSIMQSCRMRKAHVPSARGVLTERTSSALTLTSLRLREHAQWREACTPFKISFECDEEKFICNFLLNPLHLPLSFASMQQGNARNEDTNELPGWVEQTRGLACQEMFSSFRKLSRRSETRESVQNEESRFSTSQP